MFLCPHCQGRLQRVQGPHGLHWVCPDCHGRAVAFTVLRKSLGEEPVRQLWRVTRLGPSSRGRRCPTCRAPMKEVVPTPRSPRLEVCTLCQFVWFDPDEYQGAGGEPRAPLPGREIDPPARSRVREILAEHEEKTRHETSGMPPSAGDWELIPMLMGYPIEQKPSASHQIPWATWVTAALILVISGLAMPRLDDAMAALAFIPAEPFRLGGLTSLTSFFLHGQWLHLLGNLYFFLVFGDNVEEFLGPRRFLGLLALATVAGDIAHGLASWGSPVPSIGASGGISGILCFYALQFPHARLGILMRYGYLPFRWVTFSARTGFLCWLLLQAFTVGQQLLGMGTVSGFAHLGGAAVGAVAWGYLRRSERMPSPQRPHG